MSYQVSINELALARILEQARYIAIDCQAPLNSKRWLRRVLAAVETVSEFPQRGALAEENEFCDYEVRHLLVGDYLLLFTILEDDRVVWVVGFRHGSRLPRPNDLPNSPADFKSSDEW